MKHYGLLYGVDTTNGKLPTKANPDLIPYFDKTSWFCVQKYLKKILTKKGIEEIMRYLQRQKPTEPEYDVDRPQPVDSRPTSVDTDYYSIGGEGDD